MMIRMFFLLVGVSAMAQRRDLRMEIFPQRKALPISNNRYPKQALANAVNDATDLSAALKATGFQTDLVVDPDLRTMDMAVQRFVQTLNASYSVSTLLKTGEVTRLDSQKKPNAWGLYDMIGNAAEFAMASGDSSKIAVRGGSFVQKVDQVKIWRRSMLPDLETTYIDFGFRCAGPNLL